MILALVFSTALGSSGCTLAFGATGGVIGAKTARPKNEYHRTRAGIAIGMLTGFAIDFLIGYGCIQGSDWCPFKPTID